MGIRKSEGIRRESKRGNQKAKNGESEGHATAPSLNVPRRPWNGASKGEPYREGGGFIGGPYRESLVD